MLEQAQQIISLTNSRSKLTFMPLLSDDPTQRKPDITLAKKELNDWKPKIQLQEGLMKTIAYFDAILKNK